MKSKVLVALVALVAPFISFVPGRVEASANGCTFAPGGPFAQNCVDVTGDGLYVSSADASYNSGIYLSNNVCNPTGKFKYKAYGASSYSLHYAKATNCAVWRAYVTLYNPGWMSDHTSFCAAQKNSAISDYTNYACIGISS